jgi:hypothetical protein
MIASASKKLAPIGMVCVASLLVDPATAYADLSPLRRDSQSVAAHYDDIVQPPRQVPAHAADIVGLAKTLASLGPDWDLDASMLHQVTVAEPEDFPASPWGLWLTAIVGVGSGCMMRPSRSTGPLIGIELDHGKRLDEAGDVGPPCVTRESSRAEFPACTPFIWRYDTAVFIADSSPRAPPRLYRRACGTDIQG